MQKQEESFGVVPLVRVSHHWEVFLIQHHRGGYWGFPKGHAEKGETPQEAAFRELKEETNLECQTLLCPEPLLEQYSFLLEGRRIYKKVLYYIAEVRGEVLLQKQEIYDGRWLPFPQAYGQVTHQEGKAILAQVEKILSKL